MVWIIISPFRHNNTTKQSTWILFLEDMQILGGGLHFISHIRLVSTFIICLRRYELR